MEIDEATMKELLKSKDAKIICQIGIDARRDFKEIEKALMETKNVTYISKYIIAKMDQVKKEEREYVPECIVEALPYLDAYAKMIKSTLPEKLKARKIINMVHKTLVEDKEGENALTK